MGTSKSTESHFGPWLATFAGGLLAGMGLFVLGQVRFVRFLRHQVDQLSWLERWLGELTFPWRRLEEEMALVARDIPEEWVDWSQHVGLALVAFGFVFLALLLPPVLRWRAHRSG